MRSFDNIRRRVALLITALVCVWCASCTNDPTVHTVGNKGRLYIKGITSDVSVVERVSYAADLIAWRSSMRRAMR